MKFEKRADGGDVTPASSGTPDTGKKPVIVYILILFLAAFLLMFLSMLSHQRSNAEALGQLQNAVSAIQEIQSSQEQGTLVCFPESSLYAWISQSCGAQVCVVTFHLS